MTSHRRMRDLDFRRSQIDAIYEAHVAPINELVDRLREVDGRGWMPYVAPLYGGVGARVLLLLRDPARKTNNEPGFGGSGFLCPENDDATAERLATLLDEVGLEPHDCVGWNAYPWYVNQSPNTEQLVAGVGPLAELLGLLPRLEVVLLLGEHARRSWRLLMKRDPEVAARYRVIEARHPEQLAAFHEAAAILRGETVVPRVAAEADVVVAFTAWLRSEGWSVESGPSPADVVATRGAQMLIAEAKGRTTSPGLDIDTLYGQLLRRMEPREGVTVRYAVVVPELARQAALRVCDGVRAALSIDVYSVGEDGTVKQTN